MERYSDIPEFIHPQYFWDVDIQKIHPLKSKRLIIERIFSLGTSDDIAALIKFYGKDAVISEIKKVNYIDPKTLNFVSLYFNIPLDSFRCYTRKQQKAQHWSS